MNFSQPVKTICLTAPKSVKKANLNFTHVPNICMLCLEMSGILPDKYLTANCGHQAHVECVDRALQTTADTLGICNVC